MTHLYTLHIKDDNNFEIYIDNNVVREGNLLDDFNPPFNPPKEIDDPTDKKPSDWVDEAKIPDPNAVKPDNWNDDAPATIIDENDEKPDNWLDNEPLTIQDPEATKPDDWDDELDGNWEGPTIPNPRCNDVGCSPWKKRSIPNPEYKGKWKPQQIDNPAYKGVWHPQVIPNPHYFFDEHPHYLEPISALGIEIWTMKNGILFDNFIITHDKNDADNFASATWVKKHANEQAILDEETSRKTPSIMQQIGQFFDLMIKFITNPDNLLVVVGTAVVGILLPIILCFLLPSGGGGEKKKDPNKHLR